MPKQGSDIIKDFTVMAAILNVGKTYCTKIQCLYESLLSNISNKR